MKQIFLCIALITSFNSNISAQTKHNWFINWGYNRTQYLPSTIHFTGPGYNFKLREVKGKDMPETFSFNDYFNPANITIPQFSFFVGRVFDNGFQISLGWDHLKYRMDNGQIGIIDGVISEEANPAFKGVYNNKQLLLDRSFMQFEHSDGLNYIRINGDYFHTISRSKNNKFSIEIGAGAGIGPVLTWTDWTFAGTRYINKPHISGFAISLNQGLRFNMMNRFYLQPEIRTGYANLFNIQQNAGFSDRAQQKIGFVEFSVVGGYRFSFKKPNLRKQVN